MCLFGEVNHPALHYINDAYISACGREDDDAHYRRERIFPYGRQYIYGEVPSKKYLKGEDNANIRD